jgi:hypothetical protein
MLNFLHILFYVLAVGASLAFSGLEITVFVGLVFILYRLDKLEYKDHV